MSAFQKRWRVANKSVQRQAFVKRGGGRRTLARKRDKCTDRTAVGACPRLAYHAMRFRVRLANDIRDVSSKRSVGGEAAASGEKREKHVRVEVESAKRVQRNDEQRVLEGEFNLQSEGFTGRHFPVRRVRAHPNAIETNPYANEFTLMADSVASMDGLVSTEDRISTGAHAAECKPGSVRCCSSIGPTGTTDRQDGVFSAQEDRETAETPSGRPTPARLGRRIAIPGQSSSPGIWLSRGASHEACLPFEHSATRIRKRIRIPATDHVSEASHIEGDAQSDASGGSEVPASPFGETYFRDADGTPWSSARKRKLASRLRWSASIPPSSPGSPVATFVPTLRLSLETSSPFDSKGIPPTNRLSYTPLELRAHYKRVMSRFAATIREWESKRLLLHRGLRTNSCVSPFCQYERGEADRGASALTLDVELVLWRRPDRILSQGVRATNLRIAIVHIVDAPENHRDETLGKSHDHVSKSADEASLQDATRCNRDPFRAKPVQAQTIGHTATSKVRMSDHQPHECSASPSVTISGMSDTMESKANTRDAQYALLFLPEHAAVGVVEPHRRIVLLSHTWQTSLGDVPTAIAPITVIVAAFAVPVDPTLSPLTSTEQRPSALSTASATLLQFWTESVRRKSFQQAAYRLPQSTLSCLYIGCLAEAAREPSYAQTRLGLCGRLCKSPVRHQEASWFIIADLDCGATAIVRYSGTECPVSTKETSTTVYLFHHLRVLARNPNVTKQVSAATSSAPTVALGLAWTRRSRAAPLTITAPRSDSETGISSCRL